MHKIIPALLFLLASCLVLGCQNKEAETATTDADSLNLAALPGMVTRDVSMLISGSGVIRYKVITPAWYTYNLDQKSESYWYFPETLELHQLNNNMDQVGSIRCDTAYHYDRRDLWHLIGHVHVSNIRGEEFKTEELFWDMRKHTVYSDQFIHIERSTDILEGYGFTSDEQFTKYEVRTTSGIFAVRSEGEAGDYQGTAPDDGEHLAENDEPGTVSATTDTIPSRPLTPQEKAAAARQRRNRNTMPQNFQ